MSRPVAEMATTVIQLGRVQPVGPEQPSRLPANFTPNFPAAVQAKSVAHEQQVAGLDGHGLGYFAAGFRKILNGFF